MSATPAPSVRAEAAVAAFLRGIERRGLVLAQAQCGDSQRARAAADAVAQAFWKEAARLPMARWPALYWQTLLMQPALRAVPSASGDDLLSHLSPAPRAALLLRLVAGLDQRQGADVLRVSPEAYRHALYRALHALQERGIDETALRILRDRLQAQANGSEAAPDAPPRIGQSREQPVLHGVPGESGPSSRALTLLRAPRWLRQALIALLILLLIGFGATFWRPAFLRGGSATSGFATLSTRAPAATMSATAAAIGGADFDMLAAPDDQPNARDLDLYAWYAAGAGVAGAPSAAPTVLPESSTPETSAPDADAQDCADAASPGCAGAAQEENNAQ